MRSQKSLHDCRKVIMNHFNESDSDTLIAFIDSVFFTLPRESNDSMNQDDFLQVVDSFVSELESSKA